MRRVLLFGWLTWFSSPFAAAIEPAAASSLCRVYIGTYSKAPSKGIYQSILDLKTGKLSEPKLAVETTDPSFLAIHPSGKYLYAVGEINEFSGEKAGSVSAFTINADTGDLTLINRQSSKGTGPCHISLDPGGNVALVANYGGGSVALLPIGADGSLKPATTFIQHQGKSTNSQRQNEPHAHSINTDSQGKFAIAADLGLDQLLIYKLDVADGKLLSHDPAFVKVAPGSGPRHFAFSPDSKHAYVINEMANTMNAFDYDSTKGVLTPIQTISTLPPTFSGESSTAEVQVHPSGKFVYGSNRGHDSLAIFHVDPANGHLTAKGHVLTQGKSPRNFGIDPTGQFLLAANGNSNSIVVFKIDQANGSLEPTGQTLSVGSPVCIKFLPIAK